MIVEFGGHPRCIFREADDFGFKVLDLVAPPRRLGGTDEPPLVEANVDKNRVVPLPLPSQLLEGLPAGENWLTTSARTLARLHATFLIAEDPERRLDARKAAALMHQVSLVRHIVARPELRRVLIGDEVGLGKTIEAGLLIREFLSQNPALRVLYLAPARLVPNVTRELRDKLDLDARCWVAGAASDARLKDDKLVVASIHKAVFAGNLETVLASGPWDVIVVDECHHLSDWDPDGGSPNRSFKLVSDLRAAQRPDGRLILMSGTPHQGNEARFRNVLRLLSDDGKNIESAGGRVIFRTKDRVRDWRGAPLFPARVIRQPTVVQLGAPYHEWYTAIGALYDMPGGGAARRAHGWAKGLALQWSASSVQAGLGFLARLGMRRLGWGQDVSALSKTLEALRPYRGGARNEPLPQLFSRIQKEVSQVQTETGEDEYDELEEDVSWKPDPIALSQLLERGVELLRNNAAMGKWDAVFRLIEGAGEEKVVLFAQPVETVTVVVDLLERRFGVRPAMIIGNQSGAERQAQVDAFVSDDGPRFLVSSRAGGEGLNMQRARRLIHLDVPWNPMELEQRIGRVHRFGSRKPVIIDTVVAAGCREVDMYRIARDKLRLISKHLDPEEFENLFSRVMSLVPPKELESVLSDVSAEGFDNHADAEIGRLVTQGFSSWRTFDDAYRKQAEQISAAKSGVAQWEDLEKFLVTYGGGQRVDDVQFTAFKHAADEIVDYDETVTAINFAGKTYACGDTGGLPAFGPDRRPVPTLGLNLEPVQLLLRSTFLSGASAAVVHRPEGLAFLPETQGSVAVLSFARQALQMQRGAWAEMGVTLHSYLVTPTAKTALTSEQTADLVRQCAEARRIRDPQLGNWPKVVAEAERDLALELRRPSEAEIASGVRYAVWPIAAICLFS